MLEPQSWKCSLIIQISDEHVSRWRLARHRKKYTEFKSFLRVFKFIHQPRWETPWCSWRRHTWVKTLKLFRPGIQKTHRRTGHACTSRGFPLRLVQTKPKTNDSFVPMIKRRSHWENYQANIGPIRECVQETTCSFTGHCFHCPGDKTFWILSPHISATKKVDKRQKNNSFHIQKHSISLFLCRWQLSNFFKTADAIMWLTSQQHS